MIPQTKSESAKYIDYPLLSAMATEIFRSTEEAIQRFSKA
jgi:hypothetical protein